MFKVVHVYESISYNILYLFACYICYLDVNCPSIYLYHLHDNLYLCLYLSSCHIIRVNIEVRDNKALIKP